MGALALDASAMIALLHGDDSHHDRALTEFHASSRREDSLLTSATAYSEILVHAIREERGELIKRFLERLKIEVVPVDKAIARGAAELRVSHSFLRLPDALVLATARARDARLLTFDERLAQL